MGKKTEPKQFDLSHIRVAPELQGARLASFSRRALAFLADWLLIVVSSRLLWMLVAAVALLHIWKHKRHLLRVPLLEELLQEGANRLEAMKVERALRYRFIRYSRGYAYTLVYLMVALSVAVAIGLAAGAFYTSKAGFILRHDEDSLLLEPIQALYNLFGFLGGTAGAIFYFSLFAWKWKGQTPGKRLLGIRVVRLNGDPLSLWNCFERVSGYASSASLFFSGFLQYHWDRNHQTTHDKICETIVVQE
jgi:uncharacterized RDD family membrane protein YckC